MVSKAMSAEARAAVDQFVTCLNLRVRRRFPRSPLTTTLVLTALAGGWDVKALAELCSDGILSRDPTAAAVIVRRLEWANAHKPVTPRSPRRRQPPPSARRHHGPCNHPDGHVCPWITVADNRVSRCDCHTRPGGSW